MKRLSIILLFILSITENFAQQDVKLNVLVPPAPEVSALGKFGLMPENYFTGIPDITIPLYTIQEGTLSFPLAIRYHASCLHENASEAGLGRALSTGGFIVSVTRGRSLEQSPEKGFTLSYTRGYDETYTTAEVKNTPEDQITFISFGDGESGNWTYSPVTLSDSRRKSFQGSSIRKTNGLWDTYRITVWVKGNGALMVNTQALANPLQVVDDWKLYDWVLKNPGTIMISNHGNYLDDLRLDPVTAQMTTYTYDPLVGLTSVTDNNNITTCYDYDSFGPTPIITNNKHEAAAGTSVS